MSKIVTQRTPDEFSDMTPELEEEVFTLIKLFGKEWFTWKGFKRTIKDEVTGKPRQLKPGELPEYREFTCQTGQKKYVKGIGAKYDARAHSLITVNIVNEEDRKAEKSFGNINVPGTVELVYGGHSYHRDNRFKPVPVSQTGT